MKIFFLALLLGISISSCGIYRQNVVNVPLISHKGQAQIGAHIGFTGYDAQATYAATEKIALMMNYSTEGVVRENFSVDNYTINKHSFAEVGAGYYKKRKDGWINEFFILAGNGFTSRYNTGRDTFRSHNYHYENNSGANYSRFVIQGDFGRISKIVNITFSPVLMLVHYYDIHNNYDSSYRDYAHSYVYTGGAITTSYNFLKYFKFSTQLNITIPVFGSNSYFESSPYNFSAGLIVNLDFSRRTKANKNE